MSRRRGAGFILIVWWCICPLPTWTLRSCPLVTPSKQALRDHQQVPSTCDTTMSVNDSAAPLYITIGPPCSGKTTWIGKQDVDIQDIALDDQDGVYRALPAHYFVTAPQNDTLLQEQVVGKTLLERIQAPDQAELVCLCRFLAKNVTRGELKEQLQNLHNSTDLIPTILRALDAHPQAKLPETVDLFCRQVLFTRSRQQPSAVDKAHQTLRNTPKSQAVAWGNTNLRPTNYQEALQIACEQGRPVHFVVFDGRQEQCASNFATDAFDLPAATLDQLMYRNVNRFLQTGRYIPSTVLSDMLQRSHEYLPRVATSDKVTRHDLQRHLAKVLQFDRQKDGTLVRVNRNKRPRPPDERHPRWNRDALRWNEQYDSRSRGGFRNGYRRDHSSSYRREENRSREWDTSRRRVGGRDGGDRDPQGPYQERGRFENRRGARHDHPQSGWGNGRTTFARRDGNGDGPP